MLFKYYYATLIKKERVSERVVRIGILECPIIEIRGINPDCAIIFLKRISKKSFLHFCDFFGGKVQQEIDDAK